MGTKIIWSSNALEQLEDIHFYILFESKSIRIADKVIDTIFDSTEVLKSKPEIYKLDTKKTHNDGSFRAYFVYDYSISYQLLQTVFKFFALDTHQENQRTSNGKPDSHP